MEAGSLDPAGSYMKPNWNARGLGASFVTTRLLITGRTVLAAQGSDFVKQVPGLQETVAASPLVLAAYAFVWITVFAYVFLLWRRIGRVEHDLAEVNAKLSARKRG
jgi:CcmD family protein